MKGFLGLASTALLSGVMATSATAGIIVNEDWSGETIGDHSNQLTNWASTGTSANATIVNYPSNGIDHAMELGRNAGFAKSNMDVTAATKLIIQFDFTNTQATTDGAYFGMFIRDTGGTSNPVYRVQWQGTSSSFTVRKTNTSLVPTGSPSWGSQIFADHTTHTVKMEISFDSVNNKNMIEMFMDGVSKGVVYDIHGMTNDGAGNTRRLLPNNIWSIQFSNFNNEATALNVLDNVSIVTVVPEPAGMSLMGLGGLMLMKRRKNA